MFKINIELTFSKILTVLILACALTIGLVTKDYTTLNIAIPVISTLIVSKQTNDQIKAKKNNDTV